MAWRGTAGGGGPPPLGSQRVLLLVLRILWRQLQTLAAQALQVQHAQQLRHLPRVLPIDGYAALQRGRRRPRLGRLLLLLLVLLVLVVVVVLVCP